MHVGANWPYDMWDQEEIKEALRMLAQMKADEVTISSHQCSIELLEALRDNVGITQFHIRAKTGPSNRGSYPSMILDYREWDNENTLREAMLNCFDLGIMPSVILGNEPDIEMAAQPENSDMWIYDAEEYLKWYLEESANLKLRWGSILEVSPAPLSQGWNDRFLNWFNVLYPVYAGKESDFIAEHNYVGVPPEEWFNRWQKFEQFNKPIDITEFNDNGSGPRSNSFYAVCAHVYSNSSLRSLSFFTLPGGPNSQTAPKWWFLRDGERDAIGTWRDAIGKWRKSSQKVEEATMTIHDAFIALWIAHGDYAYWTGSDWTGIFKAWSRDPAEYGSPVSDEIMTDDGRVVQAFARGVFEWKDGGLARVESGL